MHGVSNGDGAEVPQILYDTGEVALREGRDSVLFVRGRCNANQTSSPRNLVPFSNALPNAAPRFTLFAFGPGNQGYLTTAAAPARQSADRFRKQLDGHKRNATQGQCHVGCDAD